MDTYLSRTLLLLSLRRRLVFDNGYEEGSDKVFAACTILVIFVFLNAGRFTLNMTATA